MLLFCFFWSSLLHLSILLFSKSDFVQLGSLPKLLYNWTAVKIHIETLTLMIGALGKYDFDVLRSSEVRVRHLGDH